MKLIYIIIGLIFSLNAAAQRSEKITVSSKTKAQLFNKSLAWVAQNWGDLDKVNTTSDTASGTILVKGGLKAAPKTDGYAVKGLTTMDIKIVVDNGSAKLDFERATFKWDAGTLWNFEDNNGGAQQQKWKTDVLKEMDELIAAYKAEINK